jgi:hypothetical protein
MITTHYKCRCPAGPCSGSLQIAHELTDEPALHFLPKARIHLNPQPPTPRRHTFFVRDSLRDGADAAPAICMASLLCTIRSAVDLGEVVQKYFRCFHAPDQLNATFAHVHMHCIVHPFLR